MKVENVTVSRKRNDCGCFTLSATVNGCEICGNIQYKPRSRKEAAKIAEIIYIKFYGTPIIVDGIIA